MNKRHTFSLFSFRQRVLPVFLLLFATQFLVAAYWLGAPSKPAAAAPNFLPPPSINFSQSSYAVNEAAGVVTIQINASAVVTPAGGVTVFYQTLDGSAVAGSDYNTSSGTLTIPQNASSVTFNITILNDALPEAQETFNIILQNPQGATLGSPSTAVVQITSDDASPTPTGQAATPIYTDIYEPNNSLTSEGGNRPYPLQVNDATFCNTPNATLWPSGDIDFYRFSGKSGSQYIIKTDRLDVGIDTYMRLYGPQGQLLAENDDFTGRASQINYTATENGFYYVEITNRDASDPADQVYCVNIQEINPTVTPTSTPVTPQPTTTRVAGADSCEDNSAFELSCTIGPDQTYSMNFVPALNRNTDNDFYRMWIKAGNIYTCETLNLSNVNDTNMIIYDQNKNGLAGNDDKEPGDLGSKIEYYATYTGWLYVLVGPYAIPIYEETSLYTYDLSCTSLAATPTATPRPTKLPYSGGGYVPPTATPQATATPQEPIDIEATVNALLPTPTTPPSVGIIPLATSTTEAPAGQAGSMSVVLYHDSNNNRIPEANEGIRDMPVSVYDGVTGQLLAFGYTNQVGRLQFNYVTNSNIVRINVPFLGFDQTATVGTAEVKLRVVPAAGTP